VRLRVHRAATKDGYTIEDISHAIDLALIELDLDPDNDPPEILFIGPDSTGNLLELIGGEIEEGVLLIWHADRCRPQYLERLPKPGR
jgi:hypothetical protein